MERAEYSGVMVRNKKGFIFTMDAVFALTLATFAVSVLLYAHFASISTYQAPVKTVRTTLDTLLQLKTGQVVPNSPPYLTNMGMKLPAINPAGYAVFNGKSSQISTGYTYTGNPTTVSVWVYPKAYGKVMTIVHAGWNISLTTSGNLAFSSGTGFGGTSVKLPLSTWSLVTVSITSVSNPTVLVYVNGSLKTTLPLTGSLANGYHYDIGSTGSSLYWLGYMSNFQVYNTVLYSDQISSMGIGGVNEMPVSSKNVSLWLPLFSTASDHSINRYNTTAVNLTFSYPGYSNVGLDYINNNDSVLSSLGSLYLNGHAAAADAVLHNLNLSNNAAIFINKTYAPGLRVAHFNGVNSVVTVKNTSLSINQKFTISVWINMSAYSLSCGSIIGMPSSKQLLLYTLTTNSAGGCNPGTQTNEPPQFKYIDYTGAADFLSFINNIPSGKWEYLTAVMAGNTLTLYENGNQTANYTGLNHAYMDNKTLNIGFGDHYFNGSIANLQLYNSSLSGPDIMRLYTAGIAGTPVNYTSLVGWWPLLGTANDRSGNGNIGFANSNVTFASSGYNPAALLGAYQISKSAIPLPLTNSSGISKVYNISVITWK